MVLLFSIHLFFYIYLIKTTYICIINLLQNIMNREIEKLIKKAKTENSVVALFGLDETANKALLLSCFEGCATVSLKDEDDCFLANANPKQFLDLYPEPVIIDSIELSAPLLKEIVSKVKNPKKKSLKKGLRFVFSITDYSILAALSFELGPLLKTIHVPTMSYLEERGVDPFPGDDVLNADRMAAEVLLHENIYEARDAFFARLIRGAYSDVVIGKENARYFYGKLSEKIAKIVLSGKKAGEKASSFKSFLYALALRTGEALNINELANLVDADVRTVKRWIEALTANFVISFVDPYKPETSKRIIKTSKMYFSDTGLNAYLANYTDTKALAMGPLRDKIVETYVFSELRKIFLNRGMDPRNFLFYYADIDRKAVEFLINIDDTLHPVFVSSLFSKERRKEDLNALQKYGQRVGEAIRFALIREAERHNDFYDLPIYSIGL